MGAIQKIAVTGTLESLKKKTHYSVRPALIGQERKNPSIFYNTSHIFLFPKTLPYIHFSWNSENLAALTI